MPALREALCLAWDLEYKQVIDRIDHRTLGDLRKCVLELEEVITLYDEFSHRLILGNSVEVH